MIKTINHIFESVLIVTLLFFGKITNKVFINATISFLNDD